MKEKIIERFIATAYFSRNSRNFNPLSFPVIPINSSIAEVRRFSKKGSRWKKPEKMNAESNRR